MLFATFPRLSDSGAFWGDRDAFWSCVWHGFR
jgi:hypothetical protein